MKERLRDLLSEVGESFDYLRSDVRNLSRYMAELEELIEGYRAFAATVTPSTPGERAALRKLLKKTLKVVGAPPARQKAASSTDEQKAERAKPFDDTRLGTLLSERERGSCWR